LNAKELSLVAVVICFSTAVKLIGDLFFRTVAFPLLFDPYIIAMVFLLVKYPRTILAINLGLATLLLSLAVFPVTDFWVFRPLLAVVCLFSVRRAYSLFGEDRRRVFLYSSFYTPFWASLILLSAMVAVFFAIPDIDVPGVQSIREALAISRESVVLGAIGAVLSVSLFRAAVHWGISAFLYRSLLLEKYLHNPAQ